MPTKIEWTQETWNPVQGCFKVSPGCKNCYAIRQVDRLANNPNEKIAKRYFNIVGHSSIANGSRRNWTGEVGIDEEVLLQPLKRRKPTTYFLSLSDLFYTGRTATHIWKVLAIISLSPHHTFQILTKYAQRMNEIMSDPRLEDHVDDEAVDLGWCHANAQGRFPLPNLWLGVSVENQQYADERIPLLLKTPAALRFVSYEPALGPVDLWQYLGGDRNPIGPAYGGRGVDWVIVGGESGPGARPFDVEWARQTISQCRDAGVPCFVKQLGSCPISIPDRISHRGHTNNGSPRLPDGFYRYLNDKKGGNPEEWPEDLRVRELPNEYAGSN